MKPKPLAFCWRVIDFIMFPLMKLISLAPFERPQESHAWHAQKIGEDDIQTLDINKCVQIQGDEISSIKDGSGPLFHIPLIGGWKNYFVLEVEDKNVPWYVGWVVRDTVSQKVLRSEIHKMPLNDDSVRLLVGTRERITTFFGVNADGKQLSVKNIGFGKMGDGSIYGKVRLF